MGYELHFKAIKKTDAHYLVKHLKDYLRKHDYITNRYHSREHKLMKNKTYKLMVDRLLERMGSQCDDTENAIEKDTKRRKKMQKLSKKSMLNYCKMNSDIAKLDMQYYNSLEHFSEASGCFSKSSDEVALIFAVISLIPRYEGMVYLDEEVNKRFFTNASSLSNFIIYEEEIRLLHAEGKLSMFPYSTFNFITSLYDEAGEDRTIAFSIY